ncbi:MAG: ABC transporter permease [Gemmatimonadetes bacterium]|nr:ABC transporter permease [Gemmatimonadota bacterium]
MLGEIRVATRALARRPGFTVTALLTVAIAVAANTAIFSVVRGVLLAALPFSRPAELVTIDVRSSQNHLISASVPNFRDWTAQNRSLRSTAAVAPWSMTATGNGPATALGVRVVLGDFFGTLGLEPRLGRLFNPGETEREQDPVVVLGYRYWRTTLGADPGVVGRPILLDARPYVVAGVLKEGEGFPNPEVSVYVPLGTIPGLPWDDRRSSFGLEIIGRLRPETTVEQGRLDLARVGLQVKAANASDTALPELRSLTDYFVGDIRLTLWLLMGAVTLVLLIAAANVANLLLARAEERRQEMAVRTALGADRGRLVRQTLIESILLALAGGAIGAAGAVGGLSILLGLFADTLPSVARPRIQLNGQVLAFSLGLTILTGLLFGLVPALRASRVNLADEVKTRTRSSGGRDQLRNGLVVSEMALAVVLLIGAGLMLKTIDRLRHADKGFDPSHVLSARVLLPSPAYDDTTRWSNFYSGALERLRATPGVTGAAVSQLVPLSRRSWERGIWPEGVPATPGTGQSVLFNIVSADYFRTLGVEVVKGRPFTESDREGAPLVAIIDESMTARFWPNHDPVGKRVTFEKTGGGHMGEPIYRTVVGVAKNVRHYELANPSRIQVYVPWVQRGFGGTPELAIMIKTSGPPREMGTTLRRIVADLDRDVPVSDVRTVDDYVESGLSANRTLGDLLGTFAAIALALSAVGIFGVMSYTVAQRTREIGVRMAIGATRTEVLRWVTGRALLLAVLGAAIGLAAAAALSRVLAGLLYQVSPLDPTTFAGVAALLIGAALAAALVPAQRATSVDPVEALRQE